MFAYKFLCEDCKSYKSKPKDKDIKNMNVSNLSFSNEAREGFYNNDQTEIKINYQLDLSDDAIIRISQD